MLDIRAILSSSWAKYTAQAGQCIAIVIVGGLLMAVGLITLGIVSIVIGAGLFKAFGKAEQGGKLDLNDLFSEFNNFSKWIVAWAIIFIPVFVFVGIGYIPFIGGILSTLLGLAYGILLFFMLQLMLEKNQGAIEAFSGSMTYVLANLDKLIVPILAILLCEGTLILDVLGLLGKLPVIGLMLSLITVPLVFVVSLAALFIGIPWMLFARWRLFRQLFS